MFPSLPPIATADPNVVTCRTFLLPRKLIATLSGNLIHVSGSGLVDSIPLRVGKDMIIGTMQAVSAGRLPRAQERASYHEFSISSVSAGALFDSFFMDSSGLGVSLARVPAEVRTPSEPASFELRFTIFETDIPPQHHWLIRSSKYRELWVRDYSVVVR